MNKEALLRKILASHHYKITRARLVVFRLLQDSEPQAIAQLIANAKGKIDRVSVYRVVELYEKLGIIRRITIGWKYKLELSDLFLDHHHHVSCLGCGKIIAIAEDNEIERLIEAMGRENGFSITTHVLELQGYCAGCR